MDNSDYTSIFGEPTKMSIFGDSEEDYLAFRQAIIDSPAVTYDKLILPFPDIQLLPYDIYELEKYTKTSKFKDKNLFYIKNDIDGCNIIAYGYYAKDEDKFYLLAHSICNHSKYSDEILLLDPLIDNGICHFENNHIIEDLAFSNATMAACCVLGKKSSFAVWKGVDKKSLCELYSHFTLPAVKYIEERYLPQIVKPIQETLFSDQDFEPIDKHDQSLLYPLIMTPLIQYKKKSIKHHVFKISLSHTCIAKGYYDEEENHFYIMQGSIFYRSTDPMYENAQSYKTRLRMIEEVCSSHHTYYIVESDFRCRTASTAASILMGKVSHYSFWKDDDGLYLKDFYPKRFTADTPPQNL